MNLLRERYPHHLSDSKRIAKFSDKMGSAIDELNLLAGVQTGEAPGCTLSDLRVLVQETAIKGVGSGYKSLHDATVLTLMWRTFGRSIDTFFARKNQLSMATCGELFLHLARIKNSVVQGISIYKAASHWEQCMLHGLGMMFVGASEPSSHVFPLVSHASVSDFPGEKSYSQDEAILYWEKLQQKDEIRCEPPPAKRVRGKPNMSKYINDAINTVSEPSTPLPPPLTTGLSSHSLRRGSAAYANASPQLAIQWISTRGAWLLDSITKAFAYVGTTTREDQSVGKILAGYENPHLPCGTPTIATLAELVSDLEYAQLLTLRGLLFKNVSGFTDVALNLDSMVLDAALAFMLIHLGDVAASVHQEQASTGFTSHYLYGFHESLDATNAALGSRLTLDPCIDWGHQLRTFWETENYAPLERRSNGNTTILAAVIMQMLSSMGTMQRTLQKLVAIQEAKPVAGATPSPCCSEHHAVQQTTDVVAEAHSLAGCLYYWFTLGLWNTAKQRKQRLSPLTSRQPSTS
ncbi:hypothetical protein PHMEG_0002664 [Phytophthora megakarya]|uniref:Ndc10 domain-containing protein n=1 Tax=Phytophthora megakarya TaxID=4795 RepID=A0A225WZX8_9STRA|nr:hypothetical protein PHMEG_0002664 [Phytophthora megakarya]